MLIFVQAFGGSVQLPKVLKTRLGYPQMDYSVIWQVGGGSSVCQYFFVFRSPKSLHWILK